MSTTSLGEPAASDESEASQPIKYGPTGPAQSLKGNEPPMSDLFQNPLFMTSLDDASEGNVAVEALKALAYEGPPAEVAQNFREQGNEWFQDKRWKDAIEFYTKALAVDCGVDEINGACYANRAACHLELQNYRQTNLDCAEALKINPRNIKALYRSARACLALDKLSEAEDCVHRGLAIDDGNTALKNILDKVVRRKNVLIELHTNRRKREDARKAKESALKRALQIRGIAQRNTSQGSPHLPDDANVLLQDPTDPQSILFIPVIVLYPLHLQSDFIKSVSEEDVIHSQLEDILSPSNLPSWDTGTEYAYPGIEVLVEKRKYDMHGKPSLSKVGPKAPLKKLFSEGKVELVNGLLSVFVVPKLRLMEFVENWKRENPQ